MTASAPAAGAPASRWRWTLLSPFLLLAAGLACYSNSFSGPFVFDDLGSILENPFIRSLSPLWHAMLAPPDTSVSGRPLVSLSLALNFAISGLAVWSYHALNLLLHLLSGLLLLGILRRTLARLEPRGALPAGAAPGLALAAALLWLVHPLNTESVTYIIQRTELLMGACFLATFYCFIRAADPDLAPGLRRALWRIATICCCALGMASKEVMVVCPVLLLIYDRIFLAASFRELLRARGAVHLACFLSWVVLLAILTLKPRSASVGFHFVQISPWEYLMTQASVILHYLRLVFWPSPLVFDYGDWPVARSLLGALPALAGIALLLGLTALLLRRRPPLGFIGASVFGILAPTSSLVPIVTEVAAERRMYLPLAALAALVVLVTHALLHRLLPQSRRRALVSFLLLATTAALLGHLTLRRNETYFSAESIWRDAVQKRPGNPRALQGLGLALQERGAYREALLHLERARQIAPGDPDLRFNLAAVLLRVGRVQEAETALRRILRRFPDHAASHRNLGSILAGRGARGPAIAHFRRALQLRGFDPLCWVDLGQVLLLDGQREAALAALRQATRRGPELATTHARLGQALAQLDRPAEAVTSLGRAIELDRRNVAALNDLGVVLARLGQLDRARQHFLSVLGLRPDDRRAHQNLALIYTRQGRTAEAQHHLSRAQRQR